MQSKFNNWKINLIDLNFNSLLKLIRFLNFKIYNSKQILFWIYKRHVIDFYKMKNISKKILFILNKICIINISDIKSEVISNDNTIKWLISVDKFNSIETIAIPNRKENYTLCISSQVGCAMNCSFCCTGDQGFLRNMKSGEIISQIFQAQLRINKLFFGKKITNIVFMGMGEPLLNINNVLSSIEIIKNKFAFNIYHSKITVSTSGVLNNLWLLNKNKIKLAISLHSLDNKERSKLMPINKKYPIEKLLFALKNYDNFTVEYIMLKDLNDSINHAFKLVDLLSDFNCKICLIPFNYYFGSVYKQSDIKDIILFKQILIRNGMIATIRKRFGFDINGACGQLKGFLKKL